VGSLSGHCVGALAQTFHFLLRRNGGFRKRESWDYGYHGPRHQINSQSTSSTSSSYPPSPKSIYERNRNGFIPSLRSRRSAFVGLLNFHQIPFLLELGTLTILLLSAHTLKLYRRAGVWIFALRAHLRMLSWCQVGRMENQTALCS
jgi:hypothetical protein